MKLQWRRGSRMQQRVAGSGDPAGEETPEREQVRTASVTREGAEYRSLVAGRARRDMEGAVRRRGSEPVRFCSWGEPMSDAAVRAAGASALHASKPAGSTRREASVGGQSGPRRASRRRDEGGRCDGGRLQNSEEALQPCGGEVLRLRPGGVGICFLWLHPKRNS